MKNWPAGIHYEIGTWSWQRDTKGITFERLIHNDVIIYYCLHAEGRQPDGVKEKIYQLESDKDFFCEKHYDFSSEQKCIDSIKLIKEHLEKISREYTEKVDLLCHG